MNELKIQMWVTNYVMFTGSNDMFDIDEMNLLINDFKDLLNEDEQKRAIGLLKREYDTLGFY